MISKRCERCGRPFEAARDRARFCRDTCRIAAHKARAARRHADYVGSIEDVIGRLAVADVGELPQLRADAARLSGGERSAAAGARLGRTSPE